jgi:hypothetical protein
MTTTERHPIPPIVCEPWCIDGNGHTNETGREDQTCWGPQTYVSLSREEVELDQYGTYEPRFGVMAYRQWPGTAPCVYVHLDGITLPANRGTLDDSLHLTTEEAHTIGLALVKAAQDVRGNQADLHPV